MLKMKNCKKKIFQAYNIDDNLLAKLLIHLKASKIS